MEFTREAIDVARAYMKLPEKERRKFKRAIESEALNWSEPAPEPPTRAPAMERQGR